MILFVDACVRANSRTKRLAEALLAKLNEETVHVALDEISFAVTDEDYLKKRDDLISKGAFGDDMLSVYLTRIIGICGRKYGTEVIYGITAFIHDEQRKPK